MKTLIMSVVLLMFTLIFLSVTGCATNNANNAGTIPWDHPDILDTGTLPLTHGGWTH